MSLLTAFLALALGLHLCVGNEMQVSFAELSTSLPNVQKEIIDKHNELRRAVVPSASNMLKMTWNGTAAKTAESWANACTHSHSPESRRTIEGGVVCGENLFYSSIPLRWSSLIQDWFNEKNDFIYTKGPKTPTAVIGHYTQIVWYKSHLLACAAAHCQHPKYPYYFVCHYCPSGNVQGPNLYTPYKAGQPCGDCPNACDNGLCTNPCVHKNEYSNCADLKEKHTCNNEFVKTNCDASCRCTTEIQ